MPENKKHRIGGWAIFVLIAISVTLDIIGLIPVAKSILGTIYWIGTSIYLWKAGLGILNGRKLAAMLISWGAGFTPVIQELPIELTAGIIAIILMTRAEEKTGISLNPMSSGKLGPKVNVAGTRMPPQQAPLNQEGIRPPNGGLVK